MVYVRLESLADVRTFTSLKAHTRDAIIHTLRIQPTGQICQAYIGENPWKTCGNSAWESPFRARNYGWAKCVKDSMGKQLDR